MRISDWSSDVCSSDLIPMAAARAAQLQRRPGGRAAVFRHRQAVAGQARGRAVGGGDATFVAEELPYRAAGVDQGTGTGGAVLPAGLDRKRVGWGKSVSVRVDVGGRGRITKARQHIK